MTLFNSHRKHNTINWSEPHHVLVLGNSITWHPYKPEIGWRSEHGMAASRPEKDFCHVLEQRLKSLNSQTTVTGINMAEWENTFSHEYERMMGDAVKGKDMIIIRMSENVHFNRERFGEELEELIGYCRSITQAIVLCGCVWKDKVLEKAIRKLARQHKMPFVPLAQIMDGHPETNAHLGDTFVDINGDLYTIDSPFICTHPNDKGMEMIAEAIYKQLTQ